MLTAGIISVLLFVIYVAAVMLVSGVPSSLSDTYYLLIRRGKRFGWLFTALLWVIVFLAMPLWIEVSNPNYQCFAFISCVALAFVAASPNFKTFEGKIHAASTAVCGIASQIWVACHVPMLLLLWLVWAIGMCIDFRDREKFVECKPVFWAEVTAFAIVYSAIFLCV